MCFQKECSDRHVLSPRFNRAICASGASENLRLASYDHGYLKGTREERNTDCGCR